MFLRLGQVFGQAGILAGWGVILSCLTLTLITSLSLAAIATNGIPHEGGTYFLISRSLGPQFGGDAAHREDLGFSLFPPHLTLYWHSSLTKVISIDRLDWHTPCLQRYRGGLDLRHCLRRSSAGAYSSTSYLHQDHISMLILSRAGIESWLDHAWGLGPSVIRSRCLLSTRAVGT